MQEQAYPHERDAFASLNISKNKKFNKRDGSKIIRDICKKLLKNKYENDPNRHIESERELQQLEQACLEFNLSTEEKEKRRRKIHKKFEKVINQNIASDMEGWNDWGYVAFQAHANDGPLSFTNEDLRYAFTENGDLIIYSSCYNFSKEKMRNIKDVLTRSDYVITWFKKTSPCRTGVAYEDLWKIDTDGYVPGHYEGGTVHRGIIVGFIIHNNNV